MASGGASCYWFVGVGVLVGVGRGSPNGCYGVRELMSFLCESFFLF